MQRSIPALGSGAMRQRRLGDRDPGTPLPSEQGQWDVPVMVDTAPFPRQRAHLAGIVAQAWHHGQAHHSGGAAVSGLQPCLLWPLLLPVQEESQSRGTHTGSPVSQMLFPARSPFHTALHTLIWVHTLMPAACSHPLITSLHAELLRPHSARDLHRAILALLTACPCPCSHSVHALPGGPKAPGR